MIWLLNTKSHRKETGMSLSDEQVQALSESIDGLTKEIFNVDLRLKALCERLAAFTKAIKTSSAKE
jgi:hypothetical protein